MPFFVRQKVISVKVGVYIVKARSKKEADTVPLSERNYQGYYHDDSRKVTEAVTPIIGHPTFSGPFANKPDAEKSEAGWVEDI